MKMFEVTFKQILDNEGFLRAVELWQDNSYITITFDAMGTKKNGMRWIEVRETLNKLEKRAKGDVVRNLNDNDVIKALRTSRAEA